MPDAGRRHRVITREGRGDEVVYRVGGRRVRSRAELERIAALAVPPAWTQVEIAVSPTAKVLAKGVDAEGRVQRIYNPSFRRRRERRKFERMPRFGARLAALRGQVDRDLSARKLGRRKLTALAVQLIDSQLLRVGNTRSAERRGSYGVTTLRAEHVTVSRGGAELDFIGKSGQRQQRIVDDPRVGRLLKRLSENSSGELFVLPDADGASWRLRSRHINRYLARHLGEEFTAKDFRTWGGTVSVAAALLRAPTAEMRSPKARAAVLREAVKAAAARLGNTPAVTRSSYVDPRVLAVVDHPGVLQEAREAHERMRGRRYMDKDEQATLWLLEAMDARRR